MHPEQNGRRWALALTLLAVALALGACGREEDDAGTGAPASPGVSERAIRIGSSLPFSGPASAYRVIADGARAYFDLVNSRGGVGGRRIEYLALDDAYDPQRALQNTRRLVEQERVFALFNTLGTANTLATWDYANQREVPQVYVSTAATRWGEPDNGHPWTIGWLPTYAFEGRTYAEYLRREQPDARVAILYQNDDFGEELRRGFTEGLRGSGARVVAEESYEVTDPSVAPQVAQLARSGADAFLSATTPKAAAQAIAAAAQRDWRPTQFLYQGSASPQLVFDPVGLELAEGIVSTTMLKDAADPAFADDPAVREYRRALRRFAPRADPANFFTAYGYATAQTLVQALRDMREPTRAAFMEAVRSMDAEIPLLLPGVRVQTGEGDGYPVEALQLQRFDGRRWQPVGELVRAEGLGR
jgi:branched-chain amino acid transport system substrate-binding protein